MNNSISISERLIRALKLHRKNKTDMEDANIRIRVGSHELTKDTFEIGLDGDSLKEGDSSFERSGLTFVVDANTSRLLAHATLDIDQEGISISFDN